MDRPIVKVHLSTRLETLVPLQFSRNSISWLSITLSHLSVIAAMPFHHRDPFDRMLIAQAQVEQMPIISSDMTLDAYGVTRLW